MNNGSATGVSSLLGLPAAPSPHSCCDWNSQCPINSQWFINGLSGNFRQNRKCEMCQVNGRKDNGAGYVCIFIYVSLPIKKMVKWTANTSKGDVRAIRGSLCWTRNFSISLLQRNIWPPSFKNQPTDLLTVGVLIFHSALCYLFIYVSWSGISYNALEVMKQVAEWRISRLAALLLSRSWNHKSHLEALQSCWHVCIIFRWSCSSKERSFLNKFTRRLHSWGPP